MRLMLVLRGVGLSLRWLILLRKVEVEVLLLYDLRCTRLETREKIICHLRRLLLLFGFALELHDGISERVILIWFLRGGREKT